MKLSIALCIEPDDDQNVTATVIDSAGIEHQLNSEHGAIVIDGAPQIVATLDASEKFA